MDSPTENDASGGADANADNADHAATAPQESRWRMFFWPAMAILVMGAFLLRDRIGAQDGTRAVAVGKTVSRIELVGMTNPSNQMNSDSLKGRVTLMNFWGYWCPPCVAELPELLDLRDEFSADERFQLVSVACQGGPGDPDVFRQYTLEFLKSKDYELECYIDPNEITRNEISRHNQAPWSGYPSTILVDTEGVIRGLWFGYSPSVIRQQRAEVARLLTEKK